MLLRKIDTVASYVEPVHGVAVLPLHSSLFEKACLLFKLLLLFGVNFCEETSARC